MDLTHVNIDEEYVGKETAMAELFHSFVMCDEYEKFSKDVTKDTKIAINIIVVSHFYLITFDYTIKL